MVTGRFPFVSPFRQPISLLNCLLRGRRKRKNREKRKQFHLASSYSTTEQLEDRTLLAGASLVNIEPNIDLSLTDGEVYNEAPKELTFTFTPGQEIDPTTLSGIQIVRAGENGKIDDITDPMNDDIIIQPGFIGIGENPNEVIVRFAESLPDDDYQITIFGDEENLPPNSDVTPLLNQFGDAFENGSNQTIKFELELGAKVVAVVSQPVLRNQVLTIDDVLALQDGDTFTISVGGAQATFEMDLDGSGLNDPANIQVSYSTGDSAEEVAIAVKAAFDSSILFTDGYATISQNGADLEIAGDSFNPAISFSLIDANNSAFLRTQGQLVSKDDQILVYFNDDDLNPDLANDPRFYQIIEVIDATNPTNITYPNEIIDTAYYTATYDALSDVTVLEFTDPSMVSLTAGNKYRLRVGVSDTPNDTTNTYTTADSETITILAGNGATPTPDENGETLISDLVLENPSNNDPSNLVIDGAGNYYFVHNDGSTIRILRVDHQSNKISIIAGSDGTIALNAIDPTVDTQATDIILSGPRDLALDVDGNLYVADGAYVLKIDSVSQLVTVIAGTEDNTDTTPDLGDVPTEIKLDTPSQLAVDRAGNIYIHDTGDNTDLGYLFRIDLATGLILGVLPTSFDAGLGLIVRLEITDLETDPFSNLFFATTSSLALSSFGPFPDIYPGIFQLSFTTTGTPTLIPITGNGFSNGSLSTPPQTGDPIAGDSLAPAASIVDASNITDIDFDANGFLYYTDSNGFVVRFDPTADEADRTIEVLSGSGTGGSINDGEPAAMADLITPTSLAIGTGNVPYFFDNGHDLLLRIEDLSDQNSSFDTATDLTNQWTAGSEEFVITSEIQPQAIGLPPLPGGNDEPGHRTLPAGLDDHGAGSGTNPVTAGSVSVIYYNFRDVYGTDVQGNPLHNAITEEQKQRTREIFEIYAYYTGAEFIESANRGISVITGDLRAVDPALPVGPGGVGGVSSGSTVIMDSSDFTGPESDVFGGTWMGVAFHEIGHSLGLGHAYDIPSLMGDPLPQDGGQTVFPGDYDLVHLLRIFRNDANDIDLYQFDLDESGTFRAEVFAERLQDVSLLNSALTLYDENKNVIARNDDYFSNDSFLELSLSAGTYYIGISSTGNNIYNPEIENSGEHGTTDGQYELRLNFAADPIVDIVTPTNSEILLDESGTQFDGDSDGTPGGAYDFWFVASDASNTIYVDKTNGPGPGGDGTLGNAYSTIAEALDNVDPTTDVVRILGNGGADGDLRTTNDSDSYLVGYDDNFNPLEDGETITVPQGVTVVIDQGAVIKLQNTVIDVGSSSVLVDRSNAALQILGTPDAQVVLTAFGNDAVGGDDDGPSDGANAGDWGGIVFRSDSDYEEDSVFLNYIANADISYGGGQVFVDSVLQSFAPIHIDGARPTIANNIITFSANAAISADPNSFNESIIDAAGNYNRDQTLNRIGPDIYGNTIVDNSLNGLFIRSETLFGQEIDQVEVTARFDDTDIVHIITENLFIEAGTGGPIDMGTGLEARYSGSVRFDPGMIVKLGGSRIQTGRGNAGIIAEGTEESPIIFTSIFDDRYGAGGTFDTTNNNIEGDSEREAEIGDWGGLILNQTSHASIDHAVIAYAGGVSPIEGLSDSFNPIEVHQADLRVTNTLFENNKTVASTTDRNNLGRNESTVIFVRGAQPIIVGNKFIDNRVHEHRDNPNVPTPPPVLTDGSIININANSLSSVLHNDYGRSTGRIDAFDHLNGNHGALVRLNQFDANDMNGMVIRGELLTVESIWDDTDIDHVVFDTITVGNFHTYGGLRLQSSSDASLVVKFGANAGFTATGHGLDINDRIGGIVQILGDPQNPVVLTSVHDDTVGSGIGLDGFSITDTLTQFSIDAAAGNWTGLQFLEFSHDRNVAVFNEGELTVLDSQGDVNGIIRNAQFLGELAPDEKSGDENRRLGFEIHGSVAANNPGDADIYSFNAQAGTEVWIDIDRTGLALDTVIELLDPLGRVLAIATNNTDASNPNESPFATDPAGLIANPNFGGDFYSSNPNDAGMRVVLPGLDGILTTYFVRVRSNSSNLTEVNNGESHGNYQLQIRLRQVDEEPGSTVRHADIRYATEAIYLAGLPAHSPLINETVESNDDNDSRGAAQNLGNLLASDRNTIGVSGEIESRAPNEPLDIDFYRFELTLQDIQSIAGVNAGAKTWATVFDIDYADGLGRADTTLSVFDSEGRLIFVSRESNVEDDQDSAGQDDNDITRGSFGTLDPYIGSVHMPEAATYYVAVTANTLLASALEATYNGSDSNALVRLEPINSLQRVVEDHIGSQGYSSNGVDIEPDGALFDITDGGIDTHVTSFDLSDVVLFTTNGHNLATVDPQLGEYETNIGDIAGISTTNSNLQITDLVMRSDGRLFGIQNNRLIEINTAGDFNNSGDPITTLDRVVGTTNIPAISGSEVLPLGFTQTETNLSRQLSLFNNRGTGANDVSIDAITFARVGTQGGAPVYELYYTVTETGRDASNVPRTFQKLYQADPNTGAVLADFEQGNDGILRNGFRGYLLDDDVTVANASQGGSDGDTTGTLYIQSVVPGIEGIGIEVVIVGHDDADDIAVSGTTITIFLDQRNNGAASWNLGEIAAAINGDDDAKDLVKAGVIGTAATNAFQALGTPTLRTDGGQGDPDFDSLPRVQGMAFNNFHVNTNGVGSQLIGVTQNGKVLDISLTGFSSFTRAGGLITSELADYSGSSYNFTGAALGPQNLYDGAYDDYVFATTNDGTLVALDGTGALQSVFGPGVTAADTGTTSADIDTSSVPNFDAEDDAEDVTGNIQGLAFSPLDFNLWHTTRTRGTDAGHGINAAPDNSRVPSAIDLELDKLADDDHNFNQSDGALSFYFGLEQFTTGDNTYLSYEEIGAQLGILNSEFLRDLTSNSAIGNNVNLPGGALGSLETNEFSLAGYAAKDAPTLYFNYFLETESTNSTTTNAMRDSARVFLSTDGGTTWNLVATNNSTKSTSANPWELPTYNTHTSAENTNPDDTGRDYVQELFDNTNNANVWRQARIDLSDFAGEANIRLRFDYSTAGTIGTLNDFESDIRGGVTDAFNKSRRGQNNTGEGFYIDDIIVGFAERGEMITNANVGVDTFFNVYGPGNSEPGDAAGEILTGSYNLEIRRASEYAFLLDPMEPFIAIAQPFDTNTRLVEEDGLLGDDNFRREQGMILIESNQIQSSNYGIKVETVRGDVFEGWFPHQGGTRVLPILNTQQLAPGAVLQNNLIVNSSFSGIDVTGSIISPESVIPLVKIVNNTIYGGPLGINVFSRVSPTITNNIIANTVSGIQVDTTFSSWVVDANLFQDNLTNGTIGTNAIELLDTEALFVNAAAGNFYLADNSKAIDSSLNRLADRPLYAAVKNSLGIPVSDIFAPNFDAFGQLRVDDPTQSPPPGLGPNIFKDRGAIERADFVGPTAIITLPPDNDVNGVDLDPDATEVYISNPELFTTMIVELRDIGIGIDDEVEASQFELTAQTSSSFRTLVEGIDYIFSYNSNTNEAIFTSANGVFSLDTLYTIDIDNSDATGIKDLAGNSLVHNQQDLSTSFTIRVTDGINDPPVNNFDGTPILDAPPNLGVTTDSEVPIVFSAANENALTITDVDAFLGSGEVEVTLETVNGTLMLGSINNLTFKEGTGLGGDTKIIFTGLLADVNTALEGTTWTPDVGYYSSFNSLNQATLTLTTSDMENFDGSIATGDGAGAKMDVDVIDITVNDPPTVEFSSTEYFVSEDGTSLNVILTRIPTAASSTVQVTLTDGTATSPDDYDSTPFDITFLANESEVVIQIPIIDDELVEADETIDLEIVTVLNGNALIGSQNTATVTILNDDQAILSIVQDVAKSEDGSNGTFTFTISMTNPVDVDVHVSYFTTDGTAISADGDYDQASLGDEVITFAVGDPLTKTFTIVVNDDFVVERDETFLVTLGDLVIGDGSLADNRDVIIDPVEGSKTGTILNDEQAILSILQDVAKSEDGSNGTFTFTVSMSHAVDRDVHVSYFTTDGTAISADGDYDQASLGDEVITFAVGDPLTKTFTIVVNDDFVVERDETFLVTLGDLVIGDGSLADNRDVIIDLVEGSKTGTILNDEQAILSILQDVAKSEDGSDGTFTFTVSMSHAVDRDVHVSYFTTDGTAISADGDYDQASLGDEVITFAVGDPLTKTFTIVVNDDFVVERDETFLVTLGDLVIGDGSLADNRDVIIDLVEGSKTGTILNDEQAILSILQDVAKSEDGSNGTFTFTVSMSHAVDRDVHVSYFTTDGTAISADGDYDQASLGDEVITFAVGDPLTKTFTIVVNDDFVVERDETFLVTLGDLVIGDGSLADNRDVIIDLVEGSKTGTILNDEQAILSIVQDVAKSEDGSDGTFTFTVSMSHAVDRDVHVSYFTTDGTAISADGDYDQASLGDEVITFAVGDPLTKTFTIVVNDDFVVERDETFLVTLGDLVIGDGSLADNRDVIIDLVEGSKTGTILNDEQAILSILQDVAKSEDGSDGTFTFTVSMSHAVDRDVHVSYFTTDGTAISADGDYDQASLGDEVITFAVGDPLTKTFTIVVNDDFVVERDETFLVTLGDLVIGDGSLADNRDVIIDLVEGSKTGTILNDEQAILSILQDVAKSEDGSDGTFTFTVSMSHAVDRDVHVSYFTTDGTAISADGDYDQASLGDEVITFAVGDPLTKTFTIVVNDDFVVERDETFLVTLGDLVIGDGSLADNRDVIIDLVEGSKTGTILNDEQAILSILQDVAKSEDGSDGTFTFTVTMSRAVDRDVHVSYFTTDGTAISADGDYDQASLGDEVITFAVGDPLTKTFTIVVNDDLVVERDETFLVTLGDLVIGDGSLADNRDVIIDPVEGSKTGTILNDEQAILSILQDVAKSEDGSDGTFTFTVTMSHAVDRDVRVTYSTADGTATLADNDYDQVLAEFLFAVGGPLSQTFTVNINDELKVELDETFDVSLSNLIIGDGSLADNRNVVIDPVNGQNTGTILNDDDAELTINSVSDLESSGGLTFTVTLSNPVDTAVSVGVLTVDGTALAADGDYTPIDDPQVLTFDVNGPLTQKFTVDVNNDNTVEVDELFSIIFDNDSFDSGGREVTTMIVTGVDGVGTIRNDDTATFSITPVIDTEDNSPFRFLVELSNPVDIEVTVDVSIVPGSADLPGDISLASNPTLTFGPNDNTSQFIFVNIVQDGIPEGPETFDVKLDNLQISDDRAVHLTSIVTRGSSATSDAALAIDVVDIEGETFAFIADRDDGLQVFNVSDPDNPVLVGSHNFNQSNFVGVAQGIDVVGVYAYLAVGQAGLQILNISDPTNPFVVGSFDDQTTTARARDVQVIGNLAYLVDDSGNGGGLQIINVTNRENPELLRSLSFTDPGGLAGGVKVIGDIAYVTDGVNGLRIIDVSDPIVSEPKLLQTVDLFGETVVGLDVDEVNGFAYVVTWESGLHIIDISDAVNGNAAYESSLPTNGIATDVRVVGNFAYVADGAHGLQVIDISDPTNPEVANMQDTPGNAIGLFVEGTRAYIADSFSGFQILEFSPSTTATGIILDPLGAPLTGTASANTTISTSLVLTPTATDANGETTAVPESEPWIDEWSSFWIEVWGNTSDGSGISGGTFDFEYNTDYFSATAVEYGSAFGNSSSATIDDQTGIVSGVTGQNSLGTLGSGNQVLLARIKFESLSDDEVVIDQNTGFLGPHNLGMRVVNAQLDITDFGGVTASVAQSPTTDLWAVPFDLDDNGKIGFDDLTTFVSFYGTSVVDAASGIAWSLDFDKSGEINFQDLTYLVANYGRTKGGSQQVDLPPNFPKEWYGSDVLTDGQTPLNELIDAAVNEWRTATGNDDLTVQVLVTDLDGQQLGESHILELDENGIPVKGRVYIDDDAAGLGWYSSIEGLSFDENGQAIVGSAADGHYDLYTVLLHEIGHAAGFTTGYSAFSDHIETANSGQLQFVGSDFIAPLTDDGLHVDNTVYINDVMGATLDPSTRKMVSALDVQILQTAYEDAAGAIITPLGAPLMAAVIAPDNSTQQTFLPPEESFASGTGSQVEVQATQTTVPSIKQKESVPSKPTPEWQFVPAFVSGNSVVSLEQPDDLEQLVGSLIESSYETEPLLSSNFDNADTDDDSFGFELEDHFELNDATENDVVDEELDNLFSDWAGPLV